MQDRLRDSRLRFAVPSGESAQTDREVARFVLERIQELSQLADELEDFMRNPAFRDIFERCSDADRADPADIMHVAQRLMDFHDRFLQLGERCRGLKVPHEHAKLLRDCGRLINVPLDGFRCFIDDLVAFVAQIPGLLHHGHGVIDGGRMVLEIDLDDDVVDQIFTRVRQIMNR